MPPRGTASLWPVRILHRFRQGGLCAVGAGSDAVRRCAGFAAIAGTPRDPCCSSFGTRLAVCVFCGAGAGSRRRSHQMDRRARPALRRRRGQRLQLRALRRNRSLCQLSVGHAITSFALAFAVSAVWPRARVADDRLCRPDRGQPARAAGPSSQRRGRGRADRRGRRDGACATGSPPAVWGSPSARDGAIVPLAGPSLGRLKRVAREASAP